MIILNNINEINKKILGMVQNRKVNREAALELLTEINKNKQKPEEDIAVIGMAVRLPGIKDKDEFWEMLKNGMSYVNPLSDKRKQDTDEFLEKYMNVNNYEYVEGGYLEEIDKFDAGFFNISPKEALNMDPSQRIFLETAYEAIEDAGYGGARIQNTKTGVFVGADHSKNNILSYLSLCGAHDYSSFVGSLTGILASRVSFSLNIYGPSIVLDTACSSGMVAVHMACKSLINGESSMAIAGGVNIAVLPNKKNGPMGALETPDRIVKSFDKDANGTIFSEGVGAVLLKPLSQAIKDKDNIQVIIKGSTINNNGRGSGLTALSGEAEKKLVIENIEVSKINPETITYAELHAATTILGDSIEIAGISNAFKKYTDKKNYCAIGTVKANIGHTEACSGITALIKVILALKNKQIPPLINFNEINPLIDIEKSPFYINKKLTKWETEGVPRRASINCLSFNGTNCNMILEESEENKQGSLMKSKVNIFTLSADNETSLKELIIKYISFLEGEELNFESLCYTANTGRGHYRYRLAVICNGVAAIRQALTAFKERGYKGSEADRVFYSSFKIVSSKKQKEGNEIYPSDKAKLSVESKAIISKLKQGEEYKLEELCKIYIKGADINWEAFYEGEEIQKISLPVYAFKKDRFWPEITEVKTADNRYTEQKIAAKDIRIEGKDHSYSKIEIKLAQIWGNILGADAVNVYDSFFDLGGDSISAMAIVSVINKDILEGVTLNDILTHSTIYELAEFISTKKLTEAETTYQSIAQIDKSESYLPSNAQKRLYSIQALDKKNTSYNIPIAINIKGELSLSEVENVLELIIDRHEQLRASFHINDGKLVMKIKEKVDVSVPYINLDNRDLEEVITNYISPFDLSRSPLIRAVLIRVREKEHILVVDMNHIISDGTSVTIIMTEFINLISGNRNLPEVKAQYKDFAVWRNKLENSEEFKKQERYWKDKLLGAVSRLDLPTDFKRPKVKSSKGSAAEVKLTKELSQSVIELAKEEKVTLYMMFLAIYNILLSKYSAKNKIIVGTVVQGRNHRDIQNTVGMFVNTIAVCNEPSFNIEFDTFLKQVKNNMLEVYDNQDYDFENLVKVLNIKRDLSRNPIFDVAYTFQNMSVPDIKTEKFKICEHKIKNNMAQFDLNLSCSERNGQIVASIEYCNQLFKKATIEKMLDDLIKISEMVVKNKKLKLGDIFLTEKEYLNRNNNEFEIEFNF